MGFKPGVGPKAQIGTMCACLVAATQPKGPVRSADLQLGNPHSLCAQSLCLSDKQWADMRRLLLPACGYGADKHKPAEQASQPERDTAVTLSLLPPCGFNTVLGALLRWQGRSSGRCIDVRRAYEQLRRSRSLQSCVACTSKASQALRPACRGLCALCMPSAEVAGRS